MAKRKPVTDDDAAQLRKEMNLAQLRKEVNEIIPYGIERVGRFERARRPPGQENRPRADVERLLALRGKVKLDINIDELRGRNGAGRGRRG